MNWHAVPFQTTKRTHRLILLKREYSYDVLPPTHLVQFYSCPVSGSLQRPARADRFTIYTSPADRAIGWSDKLFASPKGRVGNLRIEDMTDEARTVMERGNSGLSIINFMSSTDKSDSDADSFGHSYFRNAPTVSSDLIIMLRDNLDPGPPGRPLEHLGDFF